MRLKTTLFLFTALLYFTQVEAQSCNGADFEERNGIAILELDSKVSGSWRKENISGASGGQALTYRGSDKFNTPGTSEIVYKVKINSPGTYRFKWRNKISIIGTGSEPANTEHNDSWLKIDASDFYGATGNTRVYPGGSGKKPVAKGSTSGGWFKIYTNSIGWSWITRTSDFENHDIYAKFNNAGVYNIRISARSKGHTVDRMVLYKENQYSNAQSESLSRAVTSCSGGTTPDNNAPTVNITNPDNGQQFDEGDNIAVRLNSNDSDGNVTKHEIFINGTRVSNQGSDYSPYVLRNATPGNYTIQATVTDNDGAKSSNTVNVSVGENTPPPTGNNAPTVSITSPNDGQNFDAGSNVPVRLSANDSDGSIKKHQIFVNNKLVDTDGAGYTPHVIQNIKPGNYAIKATVTDNGGKTASKTVNIVVGDDDTPPPSGNQAPTVSFTNLSNGDQVEVGSNVVVRISANDSDGRIVKHQVFVNGKLVDTDGADYTPHPIKNVTAGSYKIKVTVTDNQGATGSSTIDITAGTGTPPPTTSNISFNLINAATNSNIGAITDGTTINSSKAQGINIKINAPEGTKRVSYGLYSNGFEVSVGIEEFAPYAVFGDTNGNYFSETLSSGSYRLLAVAYSSATNNNSVIERKTIRFTVGSSSGKSAILFPNPVSTDGKVSLRLPEGASGKYEYSVTNSLGVQVEKGTFDAASSQRDVELSLSNIGRQVQGVYYMTLSSSGSKETIPLIRE